MYFITICTYDRMPLFGYIQDDEMVLNACGDIATTRWLALPEHHGNSIIIITDEAGLVPTVGTTPALSVSAPPIRPKGGASGSLSAIIGSYKSGVTRRIRAMLQQSNLIVWQGRYHDYIIRNEADLNHIREYIQNNPALWAEDTFCADGLM